MICVVGSIHDHVTLEGSSGPEVGSVDHFLLELVIFVVCLDLKHLAQVSKADSPPWVISLHLALILDHLISNLEIIQE